MPVTPPCVVPRADPSVSHSKASNQGTLRRPDDACVVRSVRNPCTSCRQRSAVAELELPGSRSQHRTRATSKQSVGCRTIPPIPMPPIMPNMVVAPGAVPVFQQQPRRAVRLLGCAWPRRPRCQKLQITSALQYRECVALTAKDRVIFLRQHCHQQPEAAEKAAERGLASHRV
eukprot:COSAG06_NODE_7240_length_2574_cov_9.534949_2_plen_173_part_00